MEMNHTPGPWNVANGNEVHDKKCKWDEHGARIGETPNRICLVEYPYLENTAQEANARLIAAAPELLEACKALLFISRVVDTSETPTNEDINELLNCQQRAQTAIAKAEKGE